MITYLTTKTLKILLIVMGSASILGCSKPPSITSSASSGVTGLVPVVKDPRFNGLSQDAVGSGLTGIDSSSPAPSQGGAAAPPAAGATPEPAPTPVPEAQMPPEIKGVQALTTYMVNFLAQTSPNVKPTSEEKITAFVNAYNSGRIGCAYLALNVINNHMVRRQSFNDESLTSARNWIGLLHGALLRREPTPEEGRYYERYGRAYAEKNADDEDEALYVAVRGIENKVIGGQEFRQVCADAGLRF